MADLTNTELRDAPFMAGMAASFERQLNTPPDLVLAISITQNFSASLFEAIALSEAINGEAVTHYAAELSERVFVAEYADETYETTPGGGGVSSFAHALPEQVLLYESVTATAPAHEAPALDEQVFAAEFIAVTHASAGSGSSFGQVLLEMTPLVEGVTVVGGATGTDVDPPVLSVFNPVPATTLSPTQPIEFSVTDTVLLRRGLILAQFPSGAWDTVHDGDAFAPRYSGSSRIAISGGYSYSVLPNTGWREAPTLRIIAIDSAGNETA